jgi:hypothetical protein
VKRGRLIVLLSVFLLALPIATASGSSSNNPDELKRRSIEEYFNCGSDNGGTAGSGGGCEIANAILKIFEDAGGWSCQPGNIYEDPTRPSFNPQGLYQVLRIVGKALCIAQITCVLDWLAENVLPVPVTWTDINRVVSVAKEDIVYFGRWYYLPEILNALALNYRAQDGHWPRPYSPPQLVLPPSDDGNASSPNAQTPLRPKAYLITASEDQEHLRLYVISLPEVADALREKVEKYIESAENEVQASGIPLDEDEKRALREDFLSFRKSKGLEPIRFAYIPFGIAQPAEDALGEARRVIVANLPGVLSTPGSSGQSGHLFFVFAPSERGTEDWKKITGGCSPEVQSGSPLDPGTGRNIYWPSVAGLQFFGKVPDFFNGVVRGFAPFMDLILDFAEALDRQDKDVARGFRRSMPNGGTGNTTVP